MRQHGHVDHERIRACGKGEQPPRRANGRIGGTTGPSFGLIRTWRFDTLRTPSQRGRTPAASACGPRRRGPIGRGRRRGGPGPRRSQWALVGIAVSSSSSCFARVRGRGSGAGRRCRRAGQPTRSRGSGTSSTRRRKLVPRPASRRHSDFGCNATCRVTTPSVTGRPTPNPGDDLPHLDRETRSPPGEQDTAPSSPTPSGWHLPTARDAKRRGWTTGHPRRHQPPTRWPRRRVPSPPPAPPVDPGEQQQEDG
jgi:hypothetical protein